MVKETAASHPYGRRAGGRQTADRHAPDAGGHAVVFRPQAPCAKGNRRALHPQGHGVKPFMIGGHQEKGPARRHRECAVHRRAREGMRAGGAATWRRRTRASAACATSWRRGLLEILPERPGERQPSAPPAEHDQHQLRVHRGRGHPAASQTSSASAPLPGSACTSGSLEPSHVLRAMGVPFTVAHGSVASA